MIELKVEVAYIRRYRDDVARKVTALALLKAIASSAGIAAWAIWREYAFLWGAIIAISRVADALKEVFPFAKIHKAACEHAITLNSDALFAAAQSETAEYFASAYSLK